MRSPPDDVFPMTIGGKAIAGTKLFEVTNPATEEVLARAPECSPAQLDDATGSAQRAQPDWGADEARRRALLRACAAKLKQNARALSELLTREQGKPRRGAMQEVMAAASCFRAMAQMELPADTAPGSDSRTFEIRRTPFGVVAAITPWNFPVTLAAWKIAPALVAGNTVVLKPSPHTPLATLSIGSLLQEVLPKGVLNVISGGDSGGEALILDPHVRMISITGSIETGRRVASLAAESNKGTVLELGGNDAAIVLDDCDVSAIADSVFQAAFENCGQMCVAIKRLYVHDRVFEPLVDRLVTLARETRLGDGMDPRSQMGPLNNPAQLRRIEELLADACSNGGDIRCGGERPDRPGWFFPPTIVTGTIDGSRLVDEEQFGPALPVMPFSDVEDAVERANATEFGLGGSVWAGDPVTGAGIARRLECGMAWVNQHGDLRGGYPVGGIRQSGRGYAQGPWGLQEFTQLRTVSLPAGQ